MNNAILMSLSYVLLATIVTAQVQPPEGAASKAGEVCGKAELRAKLGECFGQHKEAIACLSETEIINEATEKGEGGRPSKALMMCLCINKLEEVRTGTLHARGI